ncbi:MAG: T9SS type A sorting domain-containing protein [Bacteroidota bacterium]
MRTRSPYLKYRVILQQPASMPRLFAILMLILGMWSGNLFSQTTYMFTTAGATGPTGPSQTQLTATYNSTLSSLVTVSGGIQSFTIPVTGVYRIAARGAQGGYNGGSSAYMAGNFNLTAGSVLKILVGQQGTVANNGSNTSGGGGGGTFVSDMANVPYIVAGGGGGNADGYNGLGNATPCCLNGMEASITNNGNGFAPQTTGGTAGANGGTGGNGASCAPGASAGGGAGFYGNGSQCNGGSAATSFTNGGAAGLNAGGTAGDGGFGGGGGCYNSGTGERGGGGGGYSGGGGGTANSGYDAAGGGGGSYNNGASQTNSISVSTGNGLVTISVIYNIIVGQTSGIACNGLSTAALSSTISGGATPYGYSWSTGATTSTVSGLAAGVYTLTVIDATSQVTSTTYTVTQPPALSAISSQTNVLCHGESNGSASIIAGGGTGSLSYSWLPVGGTAPAAGNLAAGNYTCTITDANTCTSIQTVTITEPAVISVLTTLSNETITANATGLTYQWIDCNNANAAIAGETNRSFTATANGNYAVIITNGACSDTSACVSILTTGINLNDGIQGGISVYPNPGSSVINIEFLNYTNETYQVEIVNMMGQVLVNESVNTQHVKLATDHLTKGVYFVTLISNGKQYRTKILKN